MLAQNRLPPHLKKNPTPHTRRSERRALGAQDEPIAPVVQIPNAVKLALGANIAPEARVENGYKIARMIQNNDKMRILWVVLNLDKQGHGELLEHLARHLIRSVLVAKLARRLAQSREADHIRCIAQLVEHARLV